ncbi:MAG TPA: hypothetical protein VL137_03485 [Polyangiaceae bacterium]|nr:hypothetical protein [Polyangiaceae bacterium]
MKISTTTDKARFFTVCGLVLMPVLMSACKDKQKCDEAVQTTRQALTVDDTALARQWRDRSFKMCGDKAQLATLDKEILAKEDEAVTRAQAAAKKARDLAQSKVDEINRLWLGIDKLDAFQHEGKKLEKDKVEAEIKNAYSEGKRALREVDDAYQQELQQYNAGEYKLRLKMLAMKAASKTSK